MLADGGLFLLILGLDPGTATTGYGVVASDDYQMCAVCHGVVRTPASDSPPRRLQTIHTGISDILAIYDVGAVAVEKLFFNQNVQSAMSVGQARGVILLAAAQHGARVLEYTPSEVKMAVTGHGSAPKQQVQAMVKAMLSMQQAPTPDDAADALAVAVCGLRHWEWECAVEEGK